MGRRGFFVFAALVLLPAFPAVSQAQLLGPSPYLSFNDSPYGNIAFVYFHLENFESGSLSVPGVTASGGTVNGPSGATDSVDGDDGLIDGQGTNGWSFFFGSGNVGIRFTFQASALNGDLPTHVGIVWTDGSNPIRFEAFDANNNSLGVLTGDHADGTSAGTTAEDRFYGIIHPGGISSILIQDNNGIEVDHLQFGFVASSVPEPATLALSGVGATGLAVSVRKFRRRRKTRAARRKK